MLQFKKSQTVINITTETIVKTILISIAAIFALRFLSSISHQLQLIAVSAFLALALNPAVTWITLRLKSRSRVRATGAAYLIVLSLLVGMLMAVVPPLVHQTSDFIKSVPQTINNFQTQDSSLARTVRRYHIDEQLTKLSTDINDRISKDFTKPVFTTANRIVGTLVSLITIFVLTFMMLIEGPVWVDRVIRLQPAEARMRRKKLLKRMYRVVTGYVNGQVLIAAIAAGFAMIAILIASTVFDANINAVAMAGIVFMFGLIPLIGNTLAAAIVILVSLFTSVPLALTLAIYFIIYQQIENATLQPYIQAKSNQLTPLLVFTAALIGAGFGGILGAFAAIPVAGCIKILVEEHFPHLFPTPEAVEVKAPNER
jgi:predicted PurR-regulated permease PerM